MRGTPWKKLTRADLKGVFDDIGAQVILTAMDRGATGRISSRGHATIRHPDGVRTMSVTRDSSLRKAQNMWGDLRRLFPDEQTVTTATKDSTTMPKDLTPPFTDPTVPTASNGNSPAGGLVPCPAKRCTRELATEGALYTHIRAEHAICAWPGCDMGPNGTAFVGDNDRAIAGHTNIQHKGNKPWLQRDPSKRREVAVRAALTRAANKKAAAERVAAEEAKTVQRPTEPATPVPPPPAKPVPAPAPPVAEHRALPTTPVHHKPMTDAAKLRAIRDLLGEDPRVAKLEAQITELQAHLELVREAVGILDDTKKQKK